MAIAVQVDFPGVTLEQYDQASERVGLLVGGPMPRGGLFHWVAATDEGIRVVAAWEDRQTFDTYLEETVLPHYREIGVCDRPTVQYFEIHNYLGGRLWRG
jgi:hypothetical protein